MVQVECLLKQKSEVRSERLGVRALLPFGPAQSDLSSTPPVPLRPPRGVGVCQGLENLYPDPYPPIPLDKKPRGFKTPVIL
jgi:hypothetical protein